MLLKSIFAALTLAIGVVLGSTPNGTYAPGYVKCPANMTFIRDASTGLSPNETKWLNLRRPNVINSLESWLPRALANVGQNTFNVSSYISALRSNESQTPIVAIGLSGGGARATLSGYGAWQAMDERWPAAYSSGVGGLAQVSTYYAGLSGGGAPIGGLAMSNYSTVQQILDAGTYLGNISASAITYDNSTVQSELFNSYINQIALKAEQGFNVSVTDLFSFIFITEFLYNGSYPGNPVPLFGRTWSDIQSYPSFSEGLYPMPIIMAAEVVTPGIPNVTTSYGVLYPAPNSTNASLATIYEINPFEYGAWLGRVSAFAPTEYAGSLVVNGTPEACVKGFDTAGDSFVVGTGASAINLWLLENLSDGTQGLFAKRSLAELDDEVTFSKFARHHFMKRWPADEAEREANRTVEGTSPLLGLINLMQGVFNNTLFQSLYAVWPNPFLNTTADMTNYPDLLLVDGSEVDQTIPLWPIIQPERHVDFVIANDAAGTDLSNGWMNGSNLIDTAAYAHANGIPFPNVPDQATFINYNFTLFPTFFGCNDSVDVPLVLYAADAPWSAYTNETFLNSAYDTLQINTVLNNTFNLYSFGNNTVDSEWSGCLACAVMLRSLQRMNISVPEFCNRCWERHCWNGTYSSTLPNDFFELRTVLNASLTYAEFINSPVGANYSGSAGGNGSATTNGGASGRSSGSSSSSSTSSASQLGANLTNFSLFIALFVAVALLSS